MTEAYNDPSPAGAEAENAKDGAVSMIEEAKAVGSQLAARISATVRAGLCT